MIRFTCPACGEMLEAPDERAGTDFPCSKCQIPCLVPSSEATAGDAASDEKPPDPSKSSAWQKAEALVRWVTDKAIEGVPPFISSAEALAQTYIKDGRFKDNGERIDSLINWETAKNFTSGFVTGLGGLLTLPFAVPAAFGASWVIQARMAAAFARIGGYDILDDRVRTFVMLSLVGDAVKDIAKNTGIQIGRGLTKSMIEKMSGRLLIEINKRVGFRMLTKAGETGAINFMKGVPIAGGAIGGTFDAYMCRAVGYKAKELFYKPGSDDSPADSPVA